MIRNSPDNPVGGWRTLGTIDTFAISWFMTGKLEVAGSIAVLEVATRIVWYYFHERIWAAIDWGRRHPEAHQEHQSAMG